MNTNISKVLEESGKEFDEKIETYLSGEIVDRKTTMFIIRSKSHLKTSQQNLLNAVVEEIKKSMPEILETATYSEEHHDIIKIKVLNEVVEMISNKK